MKNQSSVFSLQPLNLSQGEEEILVGGRKLFPLLHKGFEGIKQIGVIGAGPQGSAQAPNLRDSLESIGSDIVVKMGLRDGCSAKSLEEAADAGFSREDGTIGEMFKVIASSDLVILLISDGGQTEQCQEIFAAMKPGATLGLSHGFLYGYLESNGMKFPDNINVIMMAPKGMGASVRKLYVQGKETEGAGINSSVAVHQDVNGKAFDYALSWAVATGAPVVFQTTLKREVASDLFGERTGLLGTEWGLAESTFNRLLFEGFTQEEAFLYAVVGLTSTVSDLISQFGLYGIYRQLDPKFFLNFQRGYVTTYTSTRGLMDKVYDEVSSWREITEVIAKTSELKAKPMSDIEASPMWQIGKSLYGTPVPMDKTLAFVAGMYVGTLMAGIDTLAGNGHCQSEVINEQLIEATDSLNPFMASRGLAHMVDHCSITARLGTRKWGPQFQLAFTCPRANEHDDRDVWNQFQTHPVHADIEKCYGLRPSVRISVD